MNTRKVMFLYVKDGDTIDPGSGPMGYSHGLAGFKPGPVGQKAGWLVYLVHTDTKRGKSPRKVRA